ncbi:hypothetical protein VN12_21300 [Pirellula sp. SH-Sr6A]|uniref:DUF4238 domain-containing protein n=1 Tax=Pirellula sp. SH-Sr6A TaxID=1632865 RepID=UPI00078D2144|nr:DUF4238 domain-containing protein [Pirellula sp. SH-Sr6A]AMV34676.1 hypothetical protein VN12_21300 [Pirellula sp. SH-Sr6A]
MIHPKHQHYVPQFLLRNFADSKGRVAVFDKATGRSFTTLPRGVAAEARFYDFIDGNGNTQTLEYELGKLEASISGMFAEIIKKESLAHLTNDERAELAYFAAVQQLRVKAIRERAQSLNAGILRVLEERRIDGGDVIKKLSENDLKNHAALVLQTAQKIGWYFFNKIWILRRAPADTPFWISDNPITLHNVVDPKQRGLDSPGVEILLPISQEFSICFMCEGHRRMLKQGMLDLQRYEQQFGRPHEGAAEIRHLAEVIEKGIPDFLTSESVDHQNLLQVQYASRFVIAPQVDFDLVKKMIEVNPTLKEPPGFTVW